MARPNHDDKHLATLQDYYARHRLIPSYAAISALLGFSAKTAAAALVRRLEAAGYLQRTPDRRLTPAARFFERPRSVASVRAGLPEAALDASADMVSVDSLLVHKPSRTFFVPVRGDSMCEAGLLDGDTAVCEQTRHARPGDIVVAVIEGELTVKTLLQESVGKGVGKGSDKSTRLVLKPENKDYPILRPDPLEIVGVVTGSFRSYRR
jgi:SOS-response transcriptional repressor LexA